MDRKWTQVGRSLQPGEDKGCFTIAAFNVLADGLAQEGNFSRVKQEHLTWKHRSPLLAAELQALGADIMGLAECNNYKSFWQPQLQQMGYESIFVPKNPSPATLYEAEADGCCLCFRTARFQLLGFITRPSNPVFVMAHLLDLQTNLHLLVCVCHLKAGRSCAKVRSAQIRTLLSIMTSFQQCLPEPPHTQFIIGDMNATASEECVEYCRSEGGFRCVFSESHYSWTTWKHRRDDMGIEHEKRESIDYILATGQPILKAFYELPSDEQVQEFGLPCSTYPSDHVAVACRIQLLSSAQ
eukprot:m.131034 g.131034  ORF g.131034 m.131034 type:complete len:297 (+) comp15738_c0_seq4:195-1085(+)